MYYVIFSGIAIPYPSLADAAFVVAFLCWIGALAKFANNIGLWSRLKKLLTSVLHFVVPIIVVASLYYVLLVVTRREGIFLAGWDAKIFFDLTYTIADIIILVMLSLFIFSYIFRLVDREARFIVAIITVGFAFNYIADLTFAYTTADYSLLAGHVVDLFFTNAMFVISVAAAMLVQREAATGSENST